MSALADRYMVLLRHGDTEGAYGNDGSRMVGAIVLHAVNRKVPKETVFRLLANPQHRGGFAALRRHRNLERWFDAEWKRAQRRVADHPLIQDGRRRSSQLGWPT